MGELLQRIGSEEIAEWIFELGVLRPEDDQRARDEAQKQATGKSSRPLTRADIAEHNT